MSLCKYRHYSIHPVTSLILNSREKKKKKKPWNRRAYAQHRTTAHLFHLAVRLHEVSDLHDLELVQPDGLSLVERLELLECSEAGASKPNGPLLGVMEFSGVLVVRGRGRGSWLLWLVYSSVKQRVLFEALFVDHEQ